VAPANAPVEGITVMGFGKAKAPPNIARAVVGVEIRSEKADSAMREVNAKVTQVIAALKQLGIADADLRTQGVSLHFEREEPPRPVYEPTPGAAPLKGPARPGAPPIEASPPAPLGYYRATNTLEVTVRNLEKVGEVLGATSAAGANLMFGLEFDIEDRTPLEAQARQKAVEDARQRAEGLAKLSGVRLGRVLSINEGGSGNPGPQPLMMARTETANVVPVERGELTVTNAVTIVYALAQ
jgi:uncharacterized protein YggE